MIEQQQTKSFFSPNVKDVWGSNHISQAPHAARWMLLKVPNCDSGIMQNKKSEPLTGSWPGKSGIKPLPAYSQDLCRLLSNA